MGEARKRKLAGLAEPKGIKYREFSAKKSHYLDGLMLERVLDEIERIK